MEAEIPKQTGDQLANLAEVALAREELQTAIQLFDLAEPKVRDPDRCAGGRWMAHMLQGDFEQAWRESDAIRRRGAPDPHRFWQGETWCKKRVVIRCLHGFGDAVQMLRFLPRLRDQVAHLVVEVPPKFVCLAPYFESMGTVITWGEQAPQVPPGWDVQMEIMELPYALRITGKDLAPGYGYLHLPASSVSAVAATLGHRTLPRVGVVWSAGTWNPSRSISFVEFRTLLEVVGLEFWSLQGEPEREAWLRAGGHSTCRDVYQCGDDILSLAVTIGHMDLVVTVDTLAAHLAGALGVPCWLLLQHRADWRWMSARSDTPWYPSLRLFRQGPAEGWAELLARVKGELFKFSVQMQQSEGKD